MAIAVIAGIVGAPLLKAIQKSSKTIERDLDDEIDRLASIFSASVDLGKIEALI